MVKAALIINALINTTSHNSGRVDTHQTFGELIVHSFICLTIQARCIYKAVFIHRDIFKVLSKSHARRTILK